MLRADGTEERLVVSGSLGAMLSFTRVSPHSHVVRHVDGIQLVG